MRNSYNSRTKNQITQFKNGQRNWTFFQRRYTYGKKVKRYTTSLIFRKMQIKTIVWYHLTHVRMVIIKNTRWWVPLVAQRQQIWLVSTRTWVRSLASSVWLRIRHCHKLWHWHRHGSDLELLWLWHRPAAAALIRPLAWEYPYATCIALKRKKKKRERERDSKCQWGSEKLECWWWECKWHSHHGKHHGSSSKNWKQELLLQCLKNLTAAAQVTEEVQCMFSPWPLTVGQGIQHYTKL